MGEHQPDGQILALTSRTLGQLHKQTGLSGTVILVEEFGDVAFPAVAIMGNMTDFAMMVQQLIDTAIAQGRPHDCIACMENYDALVRARAAMEHLGRC